MKRRYQIIILIFPLIFGIQACKSDKSDEQADKTENPIVKVETAHKSTYMNRLQLPATLLPRREANLGASLPGKIEIFHFPEGTYVQKGDLLVDLSAEAYTQALIEYNAIQKDFERVSRLRDKGSISEIEYDHIKAKLDAAKVKTEMLRKNTQVLAPFSGMIVDYLMEEGENYFFNLALEPGYSNTSGILRLMQLNPLIAEVQVNEKDLNSINTGQKVNLKVDAFPDESFFGTITYIKPMLSTMTHSATVEITIPNPKLTLKPGMFASCDIELGESQGIFIPIDAIIRQPGTSEDFVYKIENNTAIKTIIQRKRNRGEYVLVDSLNHGDTVVTKGKNNLINGVQVTIK